MKNDILVINVLRRSLKMVLWRYTYDNLVKSHILAISVLRPSLKVAIWGITWKYTQVKSHILAINVQRLSQSIAIWSNTQEYNQAKKYPGKQCPKAFSQNRSLKTHLRKQSVQKIQIVYSFIPTAIRQLFLYGSSYWHWKNWTPPKNIFFCKTNKFQNKINENSK